MAGFQVANFDFGQNIENNNIKRRQLAQQAEQSARQSAITMRGQDIQRDNAEADRELRSAQLADQRDNAAADRELKKAQLAEETRRFDKSKNQEADQFAAKLAHEDRLASLKEREMSLNERQADWADVLNQQRAEDNDLKMQMFRKQMDAYDIAAANEKVKSDEMIAQAEERKNLLNSALGRGILAAYSSGGNLFGEQLQVFNNELSSIAPSSQPFDFFGNTVTDPNTGMRTMIGDGGTMYIGAFQRDKQGNVQYGNDGSPLISMQAIPRGIVDTVLNSAYGKAYLGTGGGGNGIGRAATAGARETSASDKQKFDQRMSLLKHYQDQYDKISAVDPKDKRLEGLQKNINRLNGFLGASTGVSTQDELAHLFGISGDEVELAEDKGEEYYDDGSLTEGGKKRVMMSTTMGQDGRFRKNGNAVVNFDNGETAELEPGEETVSPDKNEVIKHYQGGTVTRRPRMEEEKPVYTEEPISFKSKTGHEFNGVGYSEIPINGGGVIYIPEGAVIENEIVDADGNVTGVRKYRIEHGERIKVPTSTPTTFSAKDEAEFMSKINSSKADKVKAARRKQKEYEKIRSEHASDAYGSTLIPSLYYY